MTRGNARELAIHLIYGREFTGDHPTDVVRLRLEDGYYEQLAAEYEIYTERPTEKQVKYLEQIVAGVHEHEQELNAIIGKFSIGWDVKRISRLNRVIMQLAAYEILYMDDVPEGVAVSEAVRLAKKYNDEMGRFINGILGAFVRAWKADPNFLENLAAEEAAKIAPAEETEEVPTEEVLEVPADEEI